MTNLTLKHLRYFEALARHRHFGRAADDCAISQPALSIQMKELEQILGLSLVERGGRQISLTGFGETFATKSREVLRSVDELADLGRASQDQLMGRLRLGIIPTIAPYLLPKVVGLLAKEFSGLEIFPREAMTHKLIEGLKEGRLDIAIVALPVSEDTLEEFPLFEEEFVFVRPKADANKPVPDPQKLREMRLLLLEEGHCFRDQALSFCRISSALPNAIPRDLMEGSSLSTLVQMVSAGIGVTLIPEMAVPFETRSARVDIVRLANPRPKRSIGMVWRKTNPLAAQMETIAIAIGKAAEVKFESKR